MTNLTVIIPNFNGKHFLSECLESLKYQNSSFEVIVIDNASTDGSTNYISKKYPEFNLIVNEDNLGFAVAVNQGIKSSNTEYVFLMNNDVVLEKDCIHNLLECIQKDEKIFAAASKMVQYEDKTVIDDAGDEYTILGYTKKIGNGKSIKLYDNSREIFSACAGASIYKKNIFNEIGYFDENFFAYMEDVDISYRARIYGYKCIYCSKAVAYHVGSATSGGKYNPFKIKLAARNNIYVPYKNMPWPQLTVNFLFLSLGFMIKYLLFMKKGYGNEYIKGLKEGINSLDKINKVVYSNKRFKNYLAIEWFIIKNTVKNIFIWL